VQLYGSQPLAHSTALTPSGTEVAFVHKFLQRYYNIMGFQNIFCHIANIFEKLAFRH